MPQTSYSRSFGGAFAGQLSDANPARLTSRLNKSGGALPAGVGVTASADGEASLPALTTDQLAGINVLVMATDPNFVAGASTYREGANMSILSEGSIWVLPEETVAVGDPVYVRFATGSGTQLGAFRKSDDSATCRIVKGARWLSGGTSSAVAEMYFSASTDQAVH